MKDNFFDQKVIDNNRNLGQLFFGYTHYCNELFWLLKQRVFTKLCVSLGYVEERQLKEALATQKRAFNAAKQLHIGEVLLQMYLLDSEQVYQISQVLGENILFCSETKQYFKAFFSTEEEKLRHGKNLQFLSAKDINKDLLLRFLRMSFRWPRAIPKNTDESHDLFVFLNMETHAQMKITALDSEFHNILGTFEHWISTPMMVDKNYLQSLSPEAAKEESKKNLELIKQVFIGYTKNLRELLWLLQQKMFEELACKYYKITSVQISDALKVQHRAFQQNKQLQLPEIMLHMYLLDEKQVHDILKGLGHRLFHHPQNDHYYLSSDSYIAPEALDCKTTLQEAVPKYETIMQAMRIDLAQPLPIPKELAPHKSFVFFRKRGDYQPEFDLSFSELKVATRSFYQFLELEVPEYSEEVAAIEESFSQTHLASQTMNSRADILAEIMSSKDEMLAIPLGEDSIVELEEATIQNSLAKRLRKTMSLSADTFKDHSSTKRKKPVTAILQKFGKTVTRTIQKQNRQKKEVAQGDSTSQAVPANRKPVNYDKYSATVYDYVLAKIDAEEKGTPSQKEILGKRTNVFEQMARKLDKPDETPQIRTNEINIYDEILSEIEIDQKKGTRELAEKRALEKEKTKAELKQDLRKEKDDFEGYYIDFQSGEQIPPDIDDVEEAEAVDEQEIMDISTEVDSFLQSFDSIDETTDIEKLYDKYGIEMSKYDPLLELGEDEDENSLEDENQKKKTEKPEKDSPLDKLASSRDNLRRTISISQPKLQNAVPTQLEYVSGFSQTRSSNVFFTMIFPILLIAFSAGLIYLFVQPYLTTVEEDKKITKENETDKNKDKNKTVIKEFPDEYFEEVPLKNKNNPQEVVNNEDVKKETPKNNNPQDKQVKPKVSKLRQALLGNEQNGDKVARTLRTIAHTGDLTVEDISFIKELHSRYPNDKKVKKLCIWAMGSIKEPEARQWLENILISSQDKDEQKSSIDALEKIGDNEAQGTILRSFQREQDPGIIEAAAYSLGKIAPKNEQVQQSMISKFYELSDETLKRRMINALSAMQLESQNTFFVRVALDTQYDMGIRLEALDALMINAAGNAKQFVSEISSLAVSQNEELKQKAEETLEFIQEGN